MPLTTYQKDNLFKGLGLFIETIRPYVVGHLSARHGEAWTTAFPAEALSEKQRASWDEGRRAGSEPATLVDFQYLSAFAYKYPDLLTPDFGAKAKKVATWFSDIAEVRHQLAHFNPVVEDDAAERAWLNMREIATKVKEPALADSLTELRNRPAEPLPAPGPAPAAPVGGPRPWFEVVTPQLDIQQGRLDESVFAANVAEVALGNGRELYRNADIFFAKTYFTQGLRTVARRVVEGLNGGADAQNRVVSLQTGFGGGKTHTLISLWHLATKGEQLSPEVANELLAASALQLPLLPNFKKAQVAVFTNATNDVASGREVPGGPHLRTLWGELAWQLGGAPAYELVRQSDQELISPGGRFGQVLALVNQQRGPALILLDELADYCVKAAGKVVGGSTLADQTISFLQELTEAVAGAATSVLVVTLPASASEVSDSPEAGQILARLQGRVGRIGTDTQPVTDEEIFEVVRRRLFEDLGHEAVRKAVVGQYHDYYQSLRSDIPTSAMQDSYRRLMGKAYPFHPELIEVFRKRWASHHGFQRTRGALRLLAAILADLWQRRGSLPYAHNLLIHTSDAKLENLDALTGTLKQLYGSGYEAVLTADVAGSSSNARKIDEAKPEYGRQGLAQGVATTILLNSFGNDGSNKGLSVKELKLSVVRPQELNHNTVNSALDELEGNAHYLYYAQSGDGKRYWFHTKPNVNILINQAKNDVTDASVESEIQRRVMEKTARVTGFKLLVNPSDDVPEQMQPTLVVLPLALSLRPDGAPGKAALARIETLATKRGNGERIYRNTLLFLLASDMGAAKLKTTVRDYLACEKIQQDYKSQLEPEQRSDLKRRGEECLTQVEKSLVAAYSVVVKHAVKGGIKQFQLKEFASTFDAQLTTNLPALLETEEVLLIKGVGIGTLRQHGLLPEPARSLRTKDVYEAFLRFDDKPMVWKQSAVQDSLLRYCLNGDFAIAASPNGNDLTRVWLKESVPMFEATDATYWLVDKATLAAESKPDPLATGGQLSVGSGSDGEDSGGGTQSGEKQPVPDSSPGGSAGAGPKTYKSVTVSGKVPIEQYTQLFASFIRPLINNQVEISISIKGRSTAATPLTENSAEYKIIKESAQQLGLTLEEE